MRTFVPRDFVPSPLFHFAQGGRRRLSLAFLCAFLPACATLNPEAFKNFQSAVAAEQKGLEAEMARDVNWTREADVQDLANRKDAPLSAYMVKESKGTEWTMETLPPHWDARRTLRTLEEFNAAFGGYVGLLSDIAAGQVKDPEAFDGTAASLNDAFRKIRETPAGLPSVEKRPLAAAAALVAESLRLYVENRRARDLARAIRDNQPLVESYADQCRALVGLIRADLKAAYADQVQAIHERWDDKRSPGRVTLTRSLFNLNEEYADAMETLKALEVSYNTLPAAHGDLADGVEKSRKPRAALAAFVRSAQGLARRTRELEKAR